jgi:hypothetical protein
MTKYRCLASHSVFYRGFGCDDHLTDSLILQGSSVVRYTRPPMLPYVPQNSFSAGSFGDATHAEVKALVRVYHPLGLGCNWALSPLSLCPPLPFQICRLSSSLICGW